MLYNTVAQKQKLYHDCYLNLSESKQDEKGRAVEIERLNGGENKFGLN